MKNNNYGQRPGSLGRAYKILIDLANQQKPERPTNQAESTPETESDDERKK